MRACERACVYVCVYGEWRGVCRRGRTLNYLKPFQILINGEGGGVKQGFRHFLKFKIKYPILFLRCAENILI